MSPAYDPFEDGVDNSDDNADCVYQGLSVSHDVRQEAASDARASLERFASCPWNARAASRSPRDRPRSRSPDRGSGAARDRDRPIWAMVVRTPRQPFSPPPPHLLSPEHAYRGKDAHGVRIPRARGGKKHWWHTGRQRTAAFSDFAEQALISQLQDRTSFSQGDLKALDVYRLHRAGGGSHRA